MYCKILAKLFCAKTRCNRLLLGDFLLYFQKIRPARPVAAKKFPYPADTMQKPVTEQHVVFHAHQRTHAPTARVDPHVDPAVRLHKREKRKDPARQRPRVPVADPAANGKPPVFGFTHTKGGRFPRKQQHPRFVVAVATIRAAQRTAVGAQRCGIAQKAERLSIDSLLFSRHTHHLSYCTINPAVSSRDRGVRAKSNPIASFFHSLTFFAVFRRSAVVEYSHKHNIL